MKLRYALCAALLSLPIGLFAAEESNLLMNALGNFRETYKNFSPEQHFSAQPKTSILLKTPFKKDMFAGAKKDRLKATRFLRTLTKQAAIAGGKKDYSIQSQIRTAHAKKTAPAQLSSFLGLIWVAAEQKDLYAMMDILLSECTCPESDLVRSILDF